MKAVLDHIGIAVTELPELSRLFSILGLQTERTEEVPEQGVRTHFLELPRETAHLEFLEPIDDHGAVARFLASRGPGIHHLSFRLPEGGLDPVIEELRNAGFRLIYDSPRPGAQGLRINFIHPASASGMLIELMEPRC